MQTDCKATESRIQKEPVNSQTSQSSANSSQIARRDTIHHRRLLGHRGPPRLPSRPTRRRWRGLSRWPATSTMGRRLLSSRRSSPSASIEYTSKLLAFALCDLNHTCVAVRIVMKRIFLAIIVLFLPLVSYGGNAEIAALLATFPKGAMILEGVMPLIELPASASVNEVLDRYLVTGVMFDGKPFKPSYKVVATEKILNEPEIPPFTAVLIEYNGQKIVFMQPDGHTWLVRQYSPVGGKWSWFN